MGGHNRHRAAPDGEPVEAAALPARATGTALWPVWNTTLHLVVSSRERLADARRLVIDQVAAVDQVCNPFHPDAEVRAVRRAQGRAVRVSGLLAELVTISLRAALLTNGCLDPHSGRVLRTADAQPRRSGASRGPLPSAPDWTGISLLDGCELIVPAGTILDLSAMAGPYTVDRCARLVHERLNIGVRVGIGGDIASAGIGPAGGRRLPEGFDPAALGVPVTLDATTSAVSRAVEVWRDNDAGALRHRSGQGTSRSSMSVWRSVAVAAFPCTYAKALSMAAMMRGHAAPGWLRGLGVSARLVAADGAVTTVGHWPSPAVG